MPPQWLIKLSASAVEKNARTIYRAAAAATAVKRYNMWPVTWPFRTRWRPPGARTSDQLLLELSTVYIPHRRTGHVPAPGQSAVVIWRRWTLDPVKSRPPIKRHWLRHASNVPRSTEGMFAVKRYDARELCGEWDVKPYSVSSQSVCSNSYTNTGTVIFW